MNKGEPVTDPELPKNCIHCNGALEQHTLSEKAGGQTLAYCRPCGKFHHKVKDHSEDILPDDGAERFWLIHYEDADKRPEIFTDEHAARYVRARRSSHWNCTLFKQVLKGE